MRAYIILALAAGVSSARTRVSFDADWRFQLGDSRTPLPCDPTSFTPLNDTQCLGFSHVSSATTPDACFSSCCLSNACSVWTFAPGAGCWVGDGCTNSLPDKAWVGGARNGPAPPPTCGPNDPCSPTFNDSSWRALSVPHDYGIEGVFDPSLDPNKGALPKNVSWYRKSFTLGASASNSLVYLQFDGVFRAADIFFNGMYVQHHEEGYTSFIVWLHNASAPLHTDGVTPNVVSLFVDGREPELWSYEGMGIYRHVWLETAPLLSIVPWGFFTTSYINGTITSPGGADAPQTSDGAIFTPTLDLANAGGSEAKGSVVFTLQDASGSTLCSSASIPYALNASGWVRLSTEFFCGSPTSPLHLWNTAPGGAYLYTAVATVLEDGSGGVVDTMSTRHGVRSALFTPTQGFVLNGYKITLRGFSNHLGFGGCGGAVPDRVSEFILVMLKSMGGNSYRTAHNPIGPEFLDLADEYGVIVWEENRFVELGVLPLMPHAQSVSSGGGAATPFSPRNLRTTPTAVPRLVADATDMVLRDRNHPSIVIWSVSLPRPPSLF
jgi:beta-galactosidase